MYPFATPTNTCHKRFVLRDKLISRIFCSGAAPVIRKFYFCPGPRQPQGAKEVSEYQDTYGCCRPTFQSLRANTSGRGCVVARNSLQLFNPPPTPPRNNTPCSGGPGFDQLVISVVHSPQKNPFIWKYARFYTHKFGPMVYVFLESSSATPLFILELSPHQLRCPLRVGFGGSGSRPFFATLFGKGSDCLGVNQPRKDDDCFLPVKMHWASVALCQSSRLLKCRKKRIEAVVPGKEAATTILRICTKTLYMHMYIYMHTYVYTVHTYIYIYICF